MISRTSPGLFAASLFAWTLAMLSQAGGQEATPPMDIEERFRRLEEVVAAQARQIQQLSDANQQLTDQLKGLRAPAPPVPSPTVPPTHGNPATLSSLLLDDGPPVGVPPPDPGPVGLPSGDGTGLGSIPTDNSDETNAALGAFSETLDAGDEVIPERDQATLARRFLTGLYDKGFVVVSPNDEQRTPYSLKVNLTSQLRYTGFARSVEWWTDSAGRVLPVRNRSFFSLNRNWLSMTGFAISPRLRYNVTLFSTSTTNQTLAFGGIGYEFDDAFTLTGGYYKVPGTREWTESLRYPLGADRTMANTFFRPGISPGIWAQGELPRNVFYYAGIFNDLDAAIGAGARTNTNMTYAANVWWEPIGEFGPGYSDEEWHEDPVLRLGSSVVFHRSLREPPLESGQSNPENTIIRLADGTPLFQLGALAPGVVLKAADVFLVSHDISFKYRGFSLSGEYYGRWLYNFEPRGASAEDKFANMFDFGGLLQGSFALVPRRFELFARTSAVFGPYGGGSEYGGGANWYPYGGRNLRTTFEVKRINHSPANNLLYGYYAGESGTLFQMQFLFDF